MRTTEMRTSVTPLSMVRTPKTCFIETDFGVHLLPSSNELENVETRLKDERFADVKLRRNVVDPLIQNGYDYVIIDAAGGRGNSLIMPLSPSSASLSR